MKKYVMRLIVAMVVAFCGTNLAVSHSGPLRGSSVPLRPRFRLTIWWI